MSATEIKQDWQHWRAYEAVKAIVEGVNPNPDIPYPYYAEIFERDEEETKALFHKVCADRGVRIVDKEDEAAPRPL